MVSAFSTDSEVQVMVNPNQCPWVNRFVAQEQRYAAVGSSSEGLHVANRARCGQFERGLQC